MQLIIVRGSDAGMAAGLRARELDPTVDVTVLLRRPLPELLDLRAPAPALRRRSRLAHARTPRPRRPSRRRAGAIVDVERDRGLVAWVYSLRATMSV